MKKLLLLPGLLSMIASAEIYEDFTPSQEPMELPVVAVQPNYVDTYLTHEYCDRDGLVMLVNRCYSEIY